MFSIAWYPGFAPYDRYGRDIMTVDIYSYVPNERIWLLDYNAKTGELIRIYR